MLNETFSVSKRILGETDNNIISDKSIVEPIENIKPLEIDIFSIRDHRQNINDLLAMESIKNNDLTKNINIKELKRILVKLNFTESDLADKCNNDITFTTLLACSISINASRQGSKDEIAQLDVCKITFSKCGINLNKLSVTSFRATKNGEIVDYKELKKRKINKDDCLKSFDAKFNGIINGWIVAKIVIGNGGHQDNVFEELYTFCDWVVKYGNQEELYIVLVDTDLIEKYNNLISKYEKYSNLLIGNHIKVQQYIIDKYYSFDTNK